LFGAVVCLAGFTAAPVSAAAPSVEEILAIGSGSTAEFSVKAANGYSIQVEGSGDEVTLSANGSEGSAIYKVPGRVSTSGIAANFGKLGVIDVEFKPSRRMKVETPPNRCEGKPHVTRWGVFVGTVRFAGERGYTRVRVSRAPGRTHVSPRWKCKRPRGGSGKAPSIPGEGSEDAFVLEISNRRTGLEAGAFAFHPPGEEGLTLFVAGIEERRKRMRVSRFAFEPGKDEDFSIDESLATATISPPKPFSGSATYQRNSDGSVSWTGSLSVMLPGMARVSLVGPDYRLRLYRLSEHGLANPAL
jgi:hypothetical protein